MAMLKNTPQDGRYIETALACVQCCYMKDRRVGEWR